MMPTLSKLVQSTWIRSRTVTHSVFCSPEALLNPSMLGGEHGKVQRFATNPHVTPGNPIHDQQLLRH